MNLQPILLGGRQSEVAIFIKHNEAPVSIDERSFCQNANLPENLPGLHVNCGERRGAKITAGTINDIAYAHGVGHMHAKTWLIPNLFNGGFVAGSGQLKAAAATVVGRRTEQ